MFVKSRSDCYSLDWTGAKHYWYCCQRMKKALPCLCCRQLKNGQLDKMSATESEM